jgi:hypothetical protein
MSVAMPLRQAKSPIHLDLILVCRRHSGNQAGDSGTGAILTSLDVAAKQISSLRKARIKVSLGDAKVILMGRFLCEAHKMRNLQVEARFLEELEQDIDTYVSQVILSKGEVLYEVAEPVQLTLFEEMGEYLANRRLQRTTNRRR